MFIYDEYHTMFDSFLNPPSGRKRYVRDWRAPPPCDRSPTTDSLAPCAGSDPRSSSQPAAAQPIAGMPIHQTCAPPAYETSAEWYRALPPPPLRPMPSVPASGRFRLRYASPHPIVAAGL